MNFRGRCRSNAIPHLHAAPPNHVGFIGDGHRRYAEDQGIGLQESYRCGAQKAKEALFWCVNSKIQHITFYALSRQNLNRPIDEIEPAFRAIEEYFYNVANDDRVHQSGIRIVCFGAIGRTPEWVQEAAEYAHSSTNHYDNYQVNIGIGYGGRRRLLHAVQRVLEKVVDDQIKPNKIQPGIIADELYDIEISSLDIIIRTSGEMRTSGFMPWFGNGHEAVFHACEALFPEMNKTDFTDALNHFMNQQHNHGNSQP